jgi:hypothetical protein
MKAEEKELIEEKFKGVYLHQEANFNSINEKLSHILEQTTKTNGKVIDLVKRVGDLETHNLGCPKPEFKKLSEDLEPVIFFAKRPKMLGLVTIGFFTVLVINVILILIK